ncbi:MAG TPA: hypothetical protein PKA63_07605 [Oligoflexia bacterium]|nr:hypothetical protein [Oligoflexia bacterium]HMP48515.1 hypothetical protein [Oligoflexia bacterium]
MAALLMGFIGFSPSFLEEYGLPNEVKISSYFPLTSQANPISYEINQYPESSNLLYNFDSLNLPIQAIYFDKT